MKKNFKFKMEKDRVRERERQKSLNSLVNSYEKEKAKLKNINK